MATEDAAFVGSVPVVYEQLLVPMIFAEPARHMAAEVLASAPRDILETAAGTGVLTRALVDACSARVTATDLNEAMLNVAEKSLTSTSVEWRVADALDLPFPDDSFDVVACQFGVMFFPDKPAGYAEARRVLRRGGTFFFNTWDRIEANPAWRAVADALIDAAPEEPLLFLRRGPYGYSSADAIRRDLEAAGFAQIDVEAISGVSHSTVDAAATAICQGTPLRIAIEAHSSMSVDDATAIAAKALRDEFGHGPFDAPISWLQVSARAGS